MRVVLVVHLAAGSALGLCEPAWSRPDLFNNGVAAGGAAPDGLGTGIVTSGNVTAPAGYEWSEMQTGNNALGFSAQQPLENRLADDFTVTSSSGWHLSSIDVYGYVTDTPLTGPSPFNFLALQIWRGRPGDSGSTIVFGDLTTNRLAASVQVNQLRGVSTGNAAGRLRTIWANTVVTDVVLPVGTYWIDYTQTAGFNPPVTIAGSRGPVVADARQYLGPPTNAWQDLIDPGPMGGTFPPVAQELPFIVRGTVVGGNCYANCDGSTTVPFLTVNDFVCFQGQFAAGLPSANCDGSTGTPMLTVNDFICFQSMFAAGCSAP
jgi:hypothetical protein